MNDNKTTETSLSNKLAPNNTPVETTLTLSVDQTKIINRTFNHLAWSDEDASDLHFKNCTISNSDFSGANLEGLYLENCQLFNCDFSGANMQNSTFKNSTFYDKTRQKGCDFQRADLRHSEFQHCDLSTNNFYRAELFQITINDCQAQGCSFVLADFVNVISKKVLFSSATLTKTNFRYSDFEGVYLEKCDLSDSVLASVILTGVNLEGANLTHTVFSPVQYNGLSLFKADLRNAEISGLDLRTLDFSGVEISQWQMLALMESLGFVVSPDK